MDFIFTRAFAFIALLVLVALTAFLAGEGYRKLARAGLITIVLSAVAGVAVGFGALMLWLLIGSRGEWSGVAALILSVYAGAGAAVLGLLAGIIQAFYRWQVYRERLSQMWAFHFVGAACIALAAVSAYPRIPGIQTNATLSRDLASGIDTLRGHTAEQELKERGPGAVKDVIAALRAVPPSRIGEFESGLNYGAIDSIHVLGELGGPEAIAELRTWFHREDAAPDIRAAAARALAQAGDTSESAAMGALLEDRTYEWRKGHPDLMWALGEMKAGDQVAHIRSALQVDDKDGNFAITLYQSGIQALRRIDSPEAQAVIAELTSTGDPWLQERAREFAKYPMQ